MAYTDTKIAITSDWLNGDNNWETLHNANLNNIRALLLPEIAEVSNNVGAPVTGNLYIVGSVGTGDFTGQNNKLAFRRASTWVFSSPANRTVKYNKATGEYLSWSGSAWIAFLSLGSRIFSSAVTGAVTLDLQVSSKFITDGAVGNITLAFSNPPVSGLQTEITYVFVQDATGGRTLTFPASVAWAGGIVPTVSSAANAEDEFRFSTRDGGVTWRGEIVAQNIS